MLLPCLENWQWNKPNESLFVCWGWRCFWERTWPAPLGFTLTWISTSDIYSCWLSLTNFYLHAWGMLFTCLGNSWIWPKIMLNNCDVEYKLVLLFIPHFSSVCWEYLILEKGPRRCFGKLNFGTQEALFFDLLKYASCVLDDSHYECFKVKVSSCPSSIQILQMVYNLTQSNLQFLQWVIRLYMICFLFIISLTSPLMIILIYNM